MTTSSSKNFELDVAEYIEEAFERCGLELRTAYLSLKKLLKELACQTIYEEEFQRALSQDEDRASFRATPDLRAYNYA
jgi:hypothetical protein